MSFTEWLCNTASVYYDHFFEQIFPRILNISEELCLLLINIYFFWRYRQQVKQEKLERRIEMEKKFWENLKSKKASSPERFGEKNESRRTWMSLYKAEGWRKWFGPTYVRTQKTVSCVGSFELPEGFEELNDFSDDDLEF